MKDVADPFAEGLFGGSPKTAISAFETFIDATTAVENPSERVISSSVPAIRSSFARQRVMQRSHGASHDTERTGSEASNAAFSETKVHTSRLSLSDKLTLSLIFAGLVRGTTPSSTRKQSGQPIQVLALDTQGGIVAVAQKKVCSSSREDSADA